MVHLIPAGSFWPHHGPPDSCRHKLKALKICGEDIKAVDQWSGGSSVVLGRNDWVFSLDEYTEAVAYISFYEERNHHRPPGPPTVSLQVYHNACKLGPPLHPPAPGLHRNARILFVDFSSAFNTNIAIVIWCVCSVVKFYVYVTRSIVTWLTDKPWWQWLSAKVHVWKKNKGAPHKLATRFLFTRGRWANPRGYTRYLAGDLTATAALLAGLTSRHSLPWLVKLIVKSGLESYVHMHQWTLEAYIADMSSTFNYKSIT